MNNQQPNNPLHGITLEMILTQLVEHYGWEEMGRVIDIRSFNNDPSIKSSLKFLRKTPWARKKLVVVYLSWRQVFNHLCLSFFLDKIYLTLVFFV